MSALDQAIATLEAIQAHGGCEFGITKDGRRMWAKSKPGAVVPCACGCGKMSQPGTKYATRDCRKRAQRLARVENERVRRAIKRQQLEAKAAAAKAALEEEIAKRPRPSSCTVCPVARLSPGLGAMCDHHARPMSVHYLGVPGRVLRARGLCPWGRP